MSLLEGIFGPDVATSEGNLGDMAADLLPEEAVHLTRMVASRRIEFAAGRMCARAAMRRLGLPPLPVLHGEDRAPIWPDGVVGSISHSGTKCVAAVALVAQGYRAIGLDIELAEPLPPELWSEICSQRELQWLQRQDPQSRGVLAKTIFSAKECAYKAQFPISRSLFGFETLGVALDLGDGSFDIVFEHAVAPFAAGHGMHGRFRISDGMIVCGMALTDA
ncbi:MAG: 4'-phosphopantetheinyl transferase superfamily protein [Proteobacteria bacterium]|nr:4'-phosphopantetheinyl transferase superfamily protein [Pseudomonadota bacterium]